LLSCILFGYTPEEMLKKFTYYTGKYSKYNLWDKITAPFRLITRGGGKNPKIVEKSIREIMNEKSVQNMEDLNMPCFIPALDISQKQTVYYSSVNLKDEKCYLDRPLYEAVRNTSSLPFFFIPNSVYIDGELHQFLDGGIMNNTPTKHLRDFVDVVIGVENIYHKKIDKRKVNIVSGMRAGFQSMRRTAVTYQQDNSDIWLQVDCKNVSYVGSSKDAEFCFMQGYEAAKKMIAENNFN